MLQKKIFRDVLEYKIGEMDVPDNIDEIGTKNMFENAFGDLHEKYNYNTIALVVFGKCDPQNINPESYNDMTINKSNNSFMYLDWLYWLLPNSDVPKLLIQHMWHRSHPAPKKPEYSKKKEKSPRESKSEDVVDRYHYDPKSNTFLVYSKIKDSTGNFSRHHPALFIESMDQIFRKYACECDIIELFTMVLRDIEIGQSIKKKKEKSHGKKEQPRHDVAHNVTFECHLKNHIMLSLSQQYRSTPSSTGGSLPVSTSRHSHFFLNPKLYEDLEKTYSDFELETLPSIKIELKDRRIQDIKKYAMNKDPRGYCLIINMSNDRQGSFLDELRMHQLFTELYFKTFIINNRSHEEIQNIVKDIATSIEAEGDIQCLFVILMSHGGIDCEDDMYSKKTKKSGNDSTSGATTSFTSTEVQTEKKEVYVFKDINGRCRSPEYLFEPFKLQNCTALHGKPKICVLQTCFGKEKMQGGAVLIRDQLHDDMQEDKSGSKEFQNSPSVPVAVPHEKSDWYKIRATIEGYRSYRTKDQGSYVIDALDKKFRKHAARSDISQLMTMVTAEVSDKGKYGLGQWQQPECTTYFNGSLYLNPGYIKLEYPALNMSKTADGDSFEVQVSKPILGSVCWASGKHIAFAKNTSNRISKYTVKGDQIQEFPDNKTAMRGINSGFMLSEDIHIIIYTKQEGEQEIMSVNVNNDETVNLTNSIGNPLTMCEINNDCFGVLCGTPNTKKDVVIEVYTNKDIMKFIEQGSTSTRDDRYDSASTPLQTQYAIRVNYAEDRNISSRDQLCYSETKFYILSFYESTVYQVNVNGKIESKRNSFDSQPVALLKGPNGTIDVACCDSVYTAVFEQKNPRLADNYPSWSAGEYVAVANCLRNTLILVPRNGENEEIIVQPDDSMKSFVSGIMSGFMLSEDKHIIIYSKDNGDREIIVSTLDRDNKTWSKSIDLTQMLKRPLTMCEINTDCFGVLRDSQDTEKDITIEVYTRHEFEQFTEEMSDENQDKALVPAQVKFIMQVNYATNSKFGLRDKIWYNQNKFYILSFDKSTVYRVDINGEIIASKRKLVSKPVALLRGSDDTIDVVCSQVLHTDVFDQRKKVPFTDSYHKWSAGDYTAVYNNTSATLKFIPLVDTKKEEISLELNSPKGIKVSGILSGLMLTDGEHLVLYETVTGKPGIIAVKLDKQKKQWSNTTDLTEMIPNPVALCEINNKCFGVLRGTPDTSEEATIEVYSRDTILKKTKTIENPINVSSKLKIEYTVRVKYLESGKINIHDHVCYSRNKFFILSFYDSTVFQVNCNGAIEESRTKFDSKPVALLRGRDDTIDVVCSQVLHTDVFDQRKKVPLTESYHKWSAGEYIAVFSNTNATLKFIPQAATKKDEISLEVNTPTGIEISGILSGFMLSEDEHLIIYNTVTESLGIIAVKLDTQKKQWGNTTDLTEMIINPLAMCEIDNDRFCVLQGLPNTDKDVTIAVYTCDEMKRFLKDTSTNKDDFIRASRKFKVNYPTGSKIDIRDQINHSKNKFFILSFCQSSVYQINIEGRIEKAETDFDSKPIALLNGPDDTIDVACCQEVYTDVLNQTKKVQQIDYYQRWHAGKYSASFGNTKSRLKFSPVHDTTKEISLEVDAPTHTVVTGIIAGLLLSEYAHIIMLTTLDESRRIVAAALDKEKETWSKTIDLTISNPIGLCEIDEYCFGVLCGNPNTNDNVTIIIYSRDEIQRCMRRSFDKDSASPPITPIYSIEVNYAKDGTIDLSDQICYSRNKFFILSINQSTVYQVAITGALNSSLTPIAKLNGLDGSIDFACCNAMCKDVLSGKKVRLSGSYASHMWNACGEAVVLNDPGLNHSTLSLIPKFQLQNNCGSKSIAFETNYQYQCVWPTNTEGVVAAGSAESCHISLVELGLNENIPITTKYLGGFDDPAKIVQCIHLNDVTHLVMFDVYITKNGFVEHKKKILKLITIKVGNKEIAMNNAEESSGNSNTNDVQSINNPVAIFIIDDLTFGVVCKTNGSEEIKMYHRENLSLVKVVKLQKSCTGSGNNSACVDVNGEFYVSNCSKQEVIHFDINGLHKKTWPTIASDGERLYPYRVMVSEDNHVFILCQDAIYRLNSTDRNFEEVFNFESKFKYKSPPEKTHEPKQSWDVCFVGNLMYSVFEETLDIYETEKGALQTTIEELEKKQQSAHAVTSGPDTPEIIRSFTPSIPANTTGDAMDTEVTRI